MGGGDSKPNPVPVALNMYVTNKTQGVEYLFVRVRGDKLREDEMYSRIQRETTVGISVGGNAGTGGRRGTAAGGTVGLGVTHRREEESRRHQVFDCLTQGGFNLLPRDEPKPFALENSTTAYISVIGSDGIQHTVWDTDLPVSPKSYSCVTVKGDQHIGISAQPLNPKPRWIQTYNAENVDISLIQQGLVEVYPRQTPRVSVYFGRVAISTNDAPPVVLASHLCGVRIEIEHGKPRSFTDMPLPENACKEGHVTSIDVLGNPGYEWFQAQRGNPVPLNAVKTSFYVSKKRQERYVGRINGDTVCSITEVEHMINYFVLNDDSKLTSGEILLLTSDPNIRPEDEEDGEEEEEAEAGEEEEEEEEYSIMHRFRAAKIFMKKRKREIYLLLLITTSFIALKFARRLVFGRSGRSPSPGSWAKFAGQHLVLFCKEEMS